MWLNAVCYICAFWPFKTSFSNGVLHIVVNFSYYSDVVITWPAPFGSSDRYCFLHADVEVTWCNHRCMLADQNGFGTRHLHHARSISALALYSTLHDRVHQLMYMVLSSVNMLKNPLLAIIYPWLSTALSLNTWRYFSILLYIHQAVNSVFCWLSSSVGIIHNSRTSMKGSVLNYNCVFGNLKVNAWILRQVLCMLFSCCFYSPDCVLPSILFPVCWCRSGLI